MMKKLSFWIWWSWRDLKARWLQVSAIALIIALGTGVFAGLDGQETWRKGSLDASYGRLNMYDLQIKLADGSFVDQAQLQTILSGITGVKVAEPRLITPTLVDASHADDTIIVRGELVGVNLASGRPQVNSIHVDQNNGRNLDAADSGTSAAVIEYKFARHYNIEPGTPIRVSGDVTLDYVGAGHSPEYFVIMPEAGSYLAEGSFAAVFTSLETAQQITGRTGLVNNVVFLLEDTADPEAIATEIEQRITEAFPEIGFESLYTEDDPIYTLSYRDAEGDQITWNVIAFLLLVGAAMGAFNLAGRLVEAQRRQIGISMALGVPHFWIAFRPMLIGIQIAVLGTIFGLLIGLGLSRLFAATLEQLYPLPFQNTDFYLPGYLQATALGILLPVIATLIPVIRAVRVAPIDAITSGYLVAKGGRWLKLANYLPLPGRSFTQMPLRNILRAPWRTGLTIIGITIAIMLLIAIVGLIDSYTQTMENADHAYRYQGQNRVLVNLDFFYSINELENLLSGMADANEPPLFQEVEPALVLGATLLKEDQEIETLLELHDMENAIWIPALLDGVHKSDQPGIIISEKAARDLGVSVGDTITLRHSYREGELAFRLIETEIPIIGIHNNPLRPLSYMDMNSASLMGLADTANLLVVRPTEQVELNAIKEALMTQPGITSVRSIGEFSTSIKDLLNIFNRVMMVVRGVVIVLAFLIALNATSISVDERIREIATMLAFGVPARTVTRMQMLENLVIGVLGTLIGLAIGWMVLNSLLMARLSEQMPDILFVVVISMRSLLLSIAIGVVVVTLTPLITIGKMRNMDIPSTLRVME